MKMKPPDEYEVRTGIDNLLLCTVDVNENGEIDLISRKGNREDHMKLNEFLGRVWEIYNLARAAGKIKEKSR